MIYNPKQVTEVFIPIPLLTKTVNKHHVYWGPKMYIAGTLNVYWMCIGVLDVLTVLFVHKHIQISEKLFFIDVPH